VKLLSLALSTGMVHVDAAGSDNRTALAQACLLGRNLPLVDFLLSAGADVGQRFTLHYGKGEGEAPGLTPVTAAIIGGDDAVFKQVL
jgi:ankyrin repeat protein